MSMGVVCDLQSDCPYSQAGRDSEAEFDTG